MSNRIFYSDNRMLGRCGNKVKKGRLVVTVTQKNTTFVEPKTITQSA